MKSRSKRLTILLCVGVLFPALTLPPSRAAEVSEKATLAFMDYAWHLLPCSFPGSDGTAIKIDKRNRDAITIPLDVARQVLSVARLSAHAEVCALPGDKIANYRSLMARERQTNKWSQQQLLYISQLHLTTVMLLTGRIKIVDKRGRKEIVIEKRAPGERPCTPEQKATVKELIAAYLKSGPPISPGRIDGIDYFGLEGDQLANWHNSGICPEEPNIAPTVPLNRREEAFAAPVGPPAQFAPPPTASEPSATTLPNPVEIRTGVIRSRFGKKRLAPLTIRTAAGTNFLVKVVDAQNGSEKLLIYIEGNKTFETKVPLGTYLIRYATGSTWYGESVLFGSETAYFRAEDTFHFHKSGNRLMGFTIELIKQVGGNLPTDPIKPEDF